VGVDLDLFFPREEYGDMAEEENEPQEVLNTEFLTWHNSAGSVHIRTASGRVIFIDKSQAELIERAKVIPRGQEITASGKTTYSKTLSTFVLAVGALDIA
jgi:hypothetical protein